MPRSSAPPESFLSTGGYINAMVTYIDVLGFRALVAQAAESASEVVRLARVLRAFRASTQAGTGGEIDKYYSRGLSGFRAFSFSDLTMRVCLLPEQPRACASALWWELLNLSSAQASLATRGIFARGGVASGRIFCDGELIFGAAPVRAYQLESEVAIFPRIVVDRPLVELASQHSIVDNWSTFIAQGEDGVCFVNYLYAQFWNDCDCDCQNDAVALLRAHQRRVKKHMNSVDERVRQKYLWLASYHNQTISRIATNPVYESLWAGVTALTIDIAYLP